MEETLPADPPRWALSEGVLEPATSDEAFAAYWLRNGFTQEDIDGCLEGLTKQTLSLAHPRMNHILIGRCREEYETHISARLLAAGGRRHDMPWGP